MFMAFVWGSMMAPSLLLASGCTGLGVGCTEVGCDDQASISIRGIEANQSYAVEIETDDGTIQCTIDTSDEMRITCDDNNLFYGSQMDTAYIYLTGTPDRVAITVRQNGTVITQDEVRPDYDQVAPNGEACGPICMQTEIPIEL